MTMKTNANDFVLEDEEIVEQPAAKTEEEKRKSMESLIEKGKKGNLSAHDLDQAIEEMEKAMKGLLAPEYKEVLLGHAEVRNTFRITGAGTVAGCYVQDGKMQRNEKVRIVRDSIVVFKGDLSSLKRFKDDAKEVAAGYECGLSFEKFNDVKVGDIIEAYVMEEVAR